MGLRLIIEDYEGSTTVFPLGEGPVTIGREESNTICLTEKNVSRQHARLTPDSGVWKVEDLESYKSEIDKNCGQDVIVIVVVVVFV